MEKDAWLICEDILSRAGNELMAEALELFRAEAAAGRIKVNGDLVTSSELSRNEERDLFVIEKLLGDEQNLRLRYENLVRAVEEGRELRAEVVERTEEIKKFLLTISQLSLTVGYARIFSLWSVDAGRAIAHESPAALLAETSKDRKDRLEALAFATTSKAFLGSGALSTDELELLRNAYKHS